MSDDAVTVVGSGLAGALMACYLGQAGRAVELYERRPDPRRAAADRGRSINLALSTRGLHALAEVGLDVEAVALGVIMRGRMIHHVDGSLTYQPYGTDDRQALHSVPRAGLNRLLVEKAATWPSVRLHFEHRCQGVNLETGALEFATPEGVKQVSSSLIVGADGVWSAVRSAMQRQERFDYSQEYLSHGYKELTVPPTTEGGFRMEKHALHIWPRGGFMMIALPNSDGSFTCTLFWPYEGENSFENLKTDQDVKRFFEKEFPDAVPLLPNLTHEYFNNPTGPLVTVRCQPWHVGARAVLVGDACHAVVPFLGQGMNAAFEDCSVLAECLAEREVAEALEEYEARRKPHADALARLCVDNFYEMRDHVGSRLFVWGKKLGLWLHWLMPSWYVPLYTMIEFTRIGYADAERWAARQARVVLGVAVLLGVGVVGLALWLLQ